MADSDRAATWLAKVRQRDTAGIKGHPWIEDVPLLAAALEAVLALADEFDAEDGVLPGTEGEDAVLLGRPVTRGDRLRAVVTAELPGEEGDRG